MQNTHTPKGVVRIRLACMLLTLVFVGLYKTTRAQVYPVTGVTTTAANSITTATYSNVAAATGTISSGLTNTYSFTYGKSTVTTANNVTLNAFVANGATYTYSGIAPVMIIRRVNINTTSPVNVVTGNRISLWFERTASNNTLSTATSGTGDGGTAALIPDYADVPETLFAGRHFNVGIDNVFQNSVATNNNNIERVDVVFKAGLQASTDVTKVGFAVFDRGADGGNDPFLIAAIKTVDASGNPTSYYPPVAITSAMYGTGISPVVYHILRKEAADASLKMMTPNQATQNRNGVFLTFSELGIPAATTTYGYSLFGPDVTYAAAADLLDWTSTTHFPANSALSGGGLDMVAVTGVAYTTSSTFLTVLAIRVEDFNAQLTGSTVQLNWQLGATDQLKLTVLERSGNGSDFSYLLNFSAPSAGPQTAFDPQPLPGANYYRLKLAGADGSATYSKVCRVDVPAAGLLSVNIYPNPVVNKRLTLDARGWKNENYEVRIFDMSSHLVLEQQLAGSPFFSKEILLPGNIPAGVYTFQLTDQEGSRVLVKTLIVQ